MKYIIIDWASNGCFDGVEFDSFDDAEAWLSEVLNLSNAYETDRQEYEIVPKGNVRESRLLEPNSPMATLKHEGE